jgi:hypothetical protein
MGIVNAWQRQAETLKVILLRMTKLRSKIGFNFGRFWTKGSEIQVGEVLWF